MFRKIIIVFSLIYPCVLWAQDDYSIEFEIHINKELTLNDVVDAAALKSPEFQVIKSKKQNAESLRGVAKRFFADIPEISLKHQNDQLMSNQGFREWESSVDFPLWMPGQRSASLSKAKMSKLEADAYEKLVILNLTGQVREILWELALNKSALEQARKNLSIAEELARDVTKRIEAGNLPRQNNLLSQKDIMNRKMDMVSAEAEYIHAAREYEVITGLLEMPAYFEEVKYEAGNIDYIPMLELYDAKVDVMAAEYREANSSWGRNPTLSVGIKRERGSLIDQNIDSFGVGLSMPLGVGTKMTSKRSQAALALAEMERDRELVKRKYHLELHEAEHSLEVCELQLPLSTEHFTMAEENLRLSQKAFDLGEIDLLDLLRMQEQFFSSSYENIEKTIECKRAVARHNQTKGVLLP